ncbi:MAG: hypothetical protein Q8920_05040 [Bacillota bacterium]|nr:hypothetical protein [Bacillota bacterium]
MNKTGVKVIVAISAFIVVFVIAMNILKAIFHIIVPIAFVIVAAYIIYLAISRNR